MEEGKSKNIILEKLDDRKVRIVIAVVILVILLLTSIIMLSVMENKAAGAAVLAVTLCYGALVAIVSVKRYDYEKKTYTTGIRR